MPPSKTCVFGHFSIPKSKAKDANYQAVCNHCGKTVSGSTKATSNFRRHLAHASSDVEKMVLGNKCDMNDKRQVSKERGESLAVEHGIKFAETSAKNSINVEEAFFTLARDIKAKMDRKLEASNPSNKVSGQHLRSEPSRKSRWWRCQLL